MTYKKSKKTITPAIQKKGGDDLNYEFTYQYDADYAHRLNRAGSEQKGWRYYTYDANGNVTSESDGVAPNEDTTTLTPVTITTHTNEAGESVYEADYAWAWPWSDSDTGSGKVSPNNKRIYEWNSRNLLMRSVVPDYDTRYAYSADGNRAAKWTSTKLSETLYFNTMWTWHIEKGLSQEQQGQYSKHIYLGETRIVTKQTSDLETSYGQTEELRHQYYYHPDHLGSAQLVTDYEGNEYQRIEYSPYGELWVEKKTANEKDMRYLPYKFTAKEQDEETGLYYYGARYLDAKYTRWLSTDPAIGEYVSKDYDGLSGGVFNPVNSNLYHYAGNNPITYSDPDGRETYYYIIIIVSNKQKTPSPTMFQQTMFTKAKGFSDNYSTTACNATAALNVFSMQYTKETGKALSLEQGIDILKNVPDKWIDKKNAKIKDLAPALNSMINYLEGKERKTIFKGRFGYSPSWLGYKKGADLTDSYLVDAVKGLTFPEHYVNETGESKGNHTVYDTYDGKTKTKKFSGILKQNRVDYYVPKKEES